MKVCVIIMRIRKKLKNFVKPLVNRMIIHFRNYPQCKKENMRNSLAENPRVVVAGRNYCSNLTMARAIGYAGYEVEILRVFQYKPHFFTLGKFVRADAYSKYIKAYHTCIARKKNKRIVKQLIQIADTNRKMLLVPVDDLVANAIDEYMEDLEPYYIMPNVNHKQGELSRLMSKSIQKELARKADLPVVNCCVIKTENGNFEIPDTVSYPCFVKPNISKNAFKTDMKKCENREELEQWLEKISAKKDVEMLVEDFINIDKELALLGVSTVEGVFIPACMEAEVEGHDARRGVAMSGHIMSCEAMVDLVNKIAQFIKSLQYEGLFDVDLIRTVGGKILFTELNLRFGGSGYAVTKSGVNLPGMFADYMLKGKAVDTNCVVKETEKYFVNEKVMLDEYAHDYLTKDEVKKIMKEVDIHFIKDKDDPLAWQHLKKFYILVDKLKWLIRFKLWYAKRKKL